MARTVGAALAGYQSLLELRFRSDLVKLAPFGYSEEDEYQSLLELRFRSDVILTEQADVSANYPGEVSISVRA